MKLTQLNAWTLTEAKTPNAAFQAWFGQSKVVDARGGPRVVYHGSKSPWIVEFDPEQEGTGVVRATPMGVIWFSDSKANASWFADTRKKVAADSEVMVYGEGTKWYAAIYDADQEQVIFSTGPYPDRETAERQGRAEAERYNAKLRQNTFVTACYLRIQNPLRLDGVIPRRPEVDQARAAGHDGIIAENVTDGSHHGTVYVIFDPRQAKAVDNVGVWSDQPSLREAVNQISPTQLTTAIIAVRNEYVRGGCPVREIGSGRCYEFLADVLTKLGLDPAWEGKGTNLRVVDTEDFWVPGDEGTFVADLNKWRRAGEKLPDLNPEKLIELLGAATHRWFRLGRLYYDAECPEGVPRILQMPFFARQIAGLQKELNRTRARR